LENWVLAEIYRVEQLQTKENGMKTTYKNPWHKKYPADERKSIGPEFYETDSVPVEHVGFLIFHRQESVFDVVKDGVCVAQMAGPNGAKRRAEELAKEGVKQ
jgi:hypothetical protein